jgi:KaiC/GvpD/RAD55 family RecA-like ATPase
MEKIKTGIVGLDDLLSGGLARGSSTIIIGPVGTLKSYMGQQFIYEGLKNGEPCAYVSTTQDLDALCDQVKSNFGWDLKTHEQKGSLNFVDLRALFEMGSPDAIRKFVDPGRVVEEIRKAGNRASGGRALVCSLSPLFNFVEDERNVLRMIYALNDSSRRMRITTVYITDQGAQSGLIEENVKSICDYVLTTEIRGNERWVRISKAITKHGIEWHKLSLTDKGVVVELVL